MQYTTAVVTLYVQLEIILNELAAEGWELVAVTETDSGWVLFLKRVIPRV